MKDKYILHSTIKNDAGKEVADTYARIDGENEMPVVSTMYRLDEEAIALDPDEVELLSRGSKDGLSPKTMNKLYSVKKKVDDSIEENKEIYEQQNSTFCQKVIEQQKKLAEELGNNTDNIVEKEPIDEDDSPEMIDI